MICRDLYISKFRNIDDLNVSLNPGLNVITGENGAGKSSILEAIYFMERVRSFKTRKSEILVKDGNNRFVIRCELIGKNREIVGIGYKNGRMEVKINGKNIRKTSEITGKYSIRLLHQGSYKLLEGPPEIRRRFMDMILFHVEPEYRILRLQYDSAKSQVNAALRSKKDFNLDSWYQYMDEAGTSIHIRRSQLINEFIKYLEHSLKLIPGLGSLSLKYLKGWSGKEKLYTSLWNSHKSAKECGYCLVGPHRADLMVYIDGKLAMERLSRGQEKLLIFCLYILFEIFCRERGKEKGIFLIDDWSNELDFNSSNILVELIRELDVQTIVTNIEWSDAFNSWYGTIGKYRIEQGTLRML